MRALILTLSLALSLAVVPPGLRALCQTSPTRPPAGYTGTIPWTAVCAWVRVAPTKAPAPTFYHLV